MQHNGKEFEMTPEKWNGRTRNMLVWNPLDTRVSREKIIGYEVVADDVFYWMDNYGKYWHHCAEIPAEENKDENEDLKAKIRSLRAKRHEMASAVSNAVWRELMDRARNIDGPINSSMVGFGFNDISDIVLNKILDYKPDADKAERKVRRMTYRELAEWLAKGNGQYKASIFGDIRADFAYHSNEEDRTLDDNYLIRYWNVPGWIEPLIEAADD